GGRLCRQSGLEGLGNGLRGWNHHGRHSSGKIYPDGVVSAKSLIFSCGAASANRLRKLVQVLELPAMKKKLECLAQVGRRAAVEKKGAIWRKQVVLAGFSEKTHDSKGITEDTNASL